MDLPPSYSLSTTTPTPEIYNFLRGDAGLTPFSHEAATRGLPHSLFTVVILYQDPENEIGTPEPIGMGRVSGDAGCFYQVTDVSLFRRSFCPFSSVDNLPESGNTNSEIHHRSVSALRIVRKDLVNTSWLRLRSGL